MTTKNDPWKICPACRGDGTCVDPNIDARGISAEEFRDDPEFAEDYLSGVYDVSCPACDGTGKIRQSHLRTLAEHASERRLAAMENGDWDGYAGAGDYRFG